MPTEDNKFESDVWIHLSERYKNFVRVGEGGTAVVYKAEDSDLLRNVAIKTMSVSRMTPDMVLRFQHEARAASKLQHPNLINVLDFGLAGNSRPYLVMDFVEGKSLEDLLQDRDCLSIEQTIAIVLEVCRGMAFAHQNGVIHRDLKPSNILLLDHPEPDVRVKVVDFGIAKLSSRDNGGERPTASRTNLAAMPPRVALERKKQGESKGRTGELMGSPFYMSPEQIRGDNVDQRTDIYSLGCIMFRMLSGMAPFEGETHLETYSQHLNDLPPLILDPVLPSELHALIDKCLEKNPLHRPSSMTEVADALREILKQRVESSQKSAGSETRAHKSEGKLRLGKRSIAAIVAVVVTGAMVSALMFWMSFKEPAATRTRGREQLRAVEKTVGSKWSSHVSADGHLIWQATPGATDADIDCILSEKAEDVSLTSTAITDAGLEKLLQLPLNDLDLSRTNINDSATPILAKMRKLKALKLESTKITNDGLRELAPLKELAYLDLDQISQISDESVEIILRQWPNIRHLNLGRTSISDRSILRLSRAENLRELELAELHLTDRAMDALMRSEITFLNLNRCTFDRRYVSELSKMRKLSHLILSEIPTFKQSDYEELQNSLSLRGCEFQCVSSLNTRMNEVSPIIDLVGDLDEPPERGKSKI
jgi:serine/threonine protein kinase